MKKAPERSRDGPLHDGIYSIFAVSIQIELFRLHLVLVFPGVSGRACGWRLSRSGELNDELMIHILKIRYAVAYATISCIRGGLVAVAVAVVRARLQNVVAEQLQQPAPSGRLLQPPLNQVAPLNMAGTTRSQIMNCCSV